MNISRVASGGPTTRSPATSSNRNAVAETNTKTWWIFATLLASRSLLVRPHIGAISHPTPPFAMETNRIFTLGRRRLQPHGRSRQRYWYCRVQYVPISEGGSHSDPDDYRLGFSHYDYPGIYQIQDFHHCGTSGDDIQDWGDRFQVQNCELSNLAECVPSLLNLTPVVTSLPLSFVL